MITTTMNINEIAFEIANDLKNVEKFISNVLPKMRRRALKRRDKRYYQVFDIKTKKHNDWIVAIDYLKSDPSLVMYCTYVNSQGYNAVMVCTASVSFVHYSGHFLERYNERFLGGKLTSKKEILKEYALRNNVASFEHPFNDERFFGCTNDGILLGYYEQETDWFNCKTFITKEMTFDSQQSTLDMASSSYQRYWNEVHGKTVVPEYYSSCTQKRLYNS